VLPVARECPRILMYWRARSFVIQSAPCSRIDSHVVICGTRRMNPAGEAPAVSGHKAPAARALFFT
jgi:hypothetical protein